MRRTVFALTFSTVLAACTMPLSPGPAAGSMSVQVAWPASHLGVRAIPPETRALTVVVISNKARVGVGTLTPQSPRAKFEKLPVGDVLVVATAADSAGNVVAAGRTSVKIEGGKTSQAELVLGPPKTVKEDLTNQLGVVLNDLFRGLVDGLLQPSLASPAPSAAPSRNPLPSSSPAAQPSSPPLQTARFEKFELEGITNPLNGPATVVAGSVVKGYMQVSGDINLATAKAFAAITGPEGPQFAPLDADLSEFEGPFTVDLSGLKALGDYTVVVSVSDDQGHSLTTPPLQFRLVPPR